MPNVNLSTLSGPELRRLLDSARQRGEAALSYRILQEMEARRESGERKGLFAARRSTEAHTVEVDLGDPMERDDDDVPPMPFWRAPSQIAEAAVPPEPEPAPDPARLRRVKTRPDTPPAPPVDDAPPPPLDPEPPLSLRDPDPGPPEDAAAGARDWDLRLPPPRVETPGPPRGLRRGLVAGFAVGIAAGVTLGWWVGGIAREAPPLAAPAAAPIQTAALEHPPAPVAPLVAEPAPAPEASPEPATTPSADLREASPTPSDVPQIAPDTEAEPAEAAPSPPARQHTEAVRTAEAPPANACANQPTPADRTICDDPELRSLQRQLRQAYNEALEAHEDRGLLRQRQLAWASARDTVTDSTRLAQLYEQRIRKLNAATAAAREQR